MRQMITRLGVYTAYPIAFAVLGVFVVLWAMFSFETLGWSAVASLATLLMTLLIQRAERRDTQAVHAKLDEILHAMGEARNEIAKVDKKEPEEIEAVRQRIRRRG